MQSGPSDDELETLKNIGPVAAAMLREVGIGTVSELRASGTAMAYLILKHRYPRRVNLMFLYAIQGALTNRHYNDFRPEEKAVLQEAVSGGLTVGPDSG